MYNYLELKQLERRETELQAQLEILGKQKPGSIIRSSNTEKDAERGDKLPMGGFKSIRSTVSISSEQTTGSVDEKKESVNIRDSSNSNKDSNDDTTEKKDEEPLQTPITSSYTGVESQSRIRTIVIPPPAIDDRATIPIDSNTHAVNDKLDEGFWK